MDVMENLVRGAEKRFSAFATRTTKPTTALDAKPAEEFLRIAVCPGCCDRTGRAPSMRLRLSSAANYRKESVTDKNSKSMMILIAGPYRSGTNDNPALIRKNVLEMESYALPIFRAGHIPILGEWLALPLVDLAG